MQCGVALRFYHAGCNPACYCRVLVATQALSATFSIDVTILVVVPLSCALCTFITSDTNAIAIIRVIVRKVAVRNSKHRRPLYWYAFLFTVRYAAHRDLIIMILRSKQVESALALLSRFYFYYPFQSTANQLQWITISLVEFMEFRLIC